MSFHPAKQYMPYTESGSITDPSLVFLVLFFKIKKKNEVRKESRKKTNGKYGEKMR